jgi:alpha,alpha-trehalase
VAAPPVCRRRPHHGGQRGPGQHHLCSNARGQIENSQALGGEVEAAIATFERAVAAINDVGLLAEEVDPRHSEMIGNFPQAFSHIGLINAAWAITQAQAAHPSD